MFSTLGGIIISGFSASSLIDSIYTLGKINDNKNTLISESIDYSKINFSKNGTKCIVAIHNTQKAGVLKIYNKRVQINTKTVVDKNGMKKIDVDRIITWDKCFSGGINLNMGLNTFVPPPIKNIIYDKNATVSINSTSDGLCDILTNTYGIKHICLPNSKELSVNFMSLENKKVFAYGAVVDDKLDKTDIHTNEKKFVAEFMGLSKVAIANKVFEKEHQQNDCKIILSTIGIVSGVCIMVVSTIKN